VTVGLTIGGVWVTRKGSRGWVCSFDAERTLNA
jgi:hypothetical protein